LSYASPLHFEPHNLKKKNTQSIEKFFYR